MLEYAKGNLTSKPTPDEARAMAIANENYIRVFWFSDDERFANNNGDMLLGDDWSPRMDELTEHWRSFGLTRIAGYLKEATG